MLLLYICVAAAHPLYNVYKILRDCGDPSDVSSIKIQGHSIMGFQSYGGFNLKMSGYPKFLAPPCGETMHPTPNVFEVQELV